MKVYNDQPIKWDIRFIQLAQLVASWSKDPSTKVGAVIVDKDHRPISIGFNGFAKGIEDSTERLNDRGVKYKLTIHAEENALMHAHRNLTGCTLYCFPFIPCSTCASKIIQSGIVRVVATSLCPERWADNFELSKQILHEAGVETTLIDFSDPIFGIVSYMCQTDYEHELGGAPDGTRLFPSVKDVQENCACTITTCGIVKVKTVKVEEP